MKVIQEIIDYLYFQHHLSTTTWQSSRRWGCSGTTVGSLVTLGAALAAAGLGPAPSAGPEFEGDVLDAEAELRLFPDSAPDPARTAGIAAEGKRAVAREIWLAPTRSALERGAAAGSADSQLTTGLWEILEAYHSPPWEVALQRWFDGAAPSGRTYRRCSRRQGDRSDVVLPGRDREGWTLTVVLDTSGSMYSTENSENPISRALGALKNFCQSANVGRVRIVQGGADVEADDVIDPSERFRVKGGGGSNMSPSLRMLAEDPDVEAVVVITDGAIDFPDEEMPYNVLWPLTEPSYADRFEPGYGRVIVLPPARD